MSKNTSSESENSLPRFRARNKARNEQRVKRLCWLILGLISLFLLLLLLPLSFSRVHYYEYGFIKSRTLGDIDRSKVYDSGIYFTGADHFFVTYPSTTQTLVLNDLSVWSKATTRDSPDEQGGELSAAGVELLIDVVVQYRLVKDRLPQLYEKVAFNFQPYVKNVVLNTLKNNATKFTSDNYLESRLQIEAELFKAVKEEALEKADVEVTNVMLHHIMFAESYYTRKLESAVQIQKSYTEEYLQETALVRGNTTIMVKKIENEALKIEQNAQSMSDLIKVNATSEAARVKGAAERAGLSVVANACGITGQKQLLSLNYLLNLVLGNSHAIKKYVNFNEMPRATSLL